MKKLALAILVLFLGTTIGYAQQRQGQRNFDPEQAAKQQTETLKKELGLDKDQEKKVHALILTTSKEMAKMRNEMRSGGGDREAMREKMMELREKQNKEMKKVLSSSQYKKYLKYQEERINRIRQGRR